VLIQHYQAGFTTGHAFNPGQHGVQIFFVLSGYLITSQLLLEERIRLKAFYIRRAFRILPPVILYLLTLVALTSQRHSRPAAAATFELVCYYFATILARLSPILAQGISGRFLSRNSFISFGRQSWSCWAGDGRC
jgi:peptidoglycan/LPS O-acetylase OafA/YrhL